MTQKPPAVQGNQKPKSPAMQEVQKGTKQGNQNPKTLQRQFPKQKIQIERPQTKNRFEVFMDTGEKCSPPNKPKPL